MQLFVFGGWTFHYYSKNGCKSDSSPQDSRLKLATFVVVSNIGLAYTTMGCFVAVKMLPISDFIVIAFTAPVPTLLLSVCIIK